MTIDSLQIPINKDLSNDRILVYGGLKNRKQATGEGGKYEQQ